MKDFDWNNPAILEKGKQYIEEAYEFASTLHGFGADAAQLLLSYKDQDPNRPRTIEIPTAYGDKLMALLMAMPRPTLNGGRRRDWSLRIVSRMIEKGASVNGAAQAEALRTTVPGGDVDKKARTIAREVRKIGLVAEAQKRRAEKKKAGKQSRSPAGKRASSPAWET